MAGVLTGNTDHGTEQLKTTRGGRMASEHTPADDIVYDLISIQYHALKAGEVYDQFIEDAHEHHDVADFVQQCKQQDAERAIRCHDLLRQLTRGGGIG
jgi:hypothetical protein